MAENTCPICSRYPELPKGFVRLGNSQALRCQSCNPKQDRSNRIYTEENDWSDFLEALGRGDRIQIDEDIYDYFLDVLPPRFMRRPVTLLDGDKRFADFGFAEGAAIITAFWRERNGPETLYFCQYTQQISGGS